MERVSSSRGLLVGVVALAVFLLFDVALFGWLIFRSLSEREISRIILETRQEAEEVAGQIAADAERYNQDLLMAVATNTEARTYIDSELAQREIIEMVHIYDRDQTLLYRSAQVIREGGEPEPLLEAEEDELLPQVVTETFIRETPYEVVEVPVGDMGKIQIGLRRKEVQKRLDALRAELLRQAGVIATLTLVLLLSAYLLIWRLMRRAQRLEDEVQESERMAYIGTLASGLAHEIRSPLNSLNLNMQMLEEDLSKGEARSGHRLLSITRSEISRLERLVSDFLQYARPKPVELRRVRAVELLRRVEAVYQGRVRGAGIRLVVDDQTGGAAVRVDCEQMHQLLLNLMENASDAVEGIDRVGRVRLSVERRGDRVVLAIEDNGRGMAAEECSHAQELFYSRRKGGTGLGLAIASRIAKSHGASLEIESTPELGTRVEIGLQAEVSDREEAKSGAPAPADDALREPRAARQTC